jgi:hypothetical protein
MTHKNIKERDGWLSVGWLLAKLERWVARLVARLLATASLWVRLQTSLKNTEWVL